LLGKLFLTESQLRDAESISPIASQCNNQAATDRVSCGDFLSSQDHELVVDFSEAEDTTFCSSKAPTGITELMFRGVKRERTRIGRFFCNKHGRC